MKLLYFIPRYDASLMGNRIHTEVIEAWRELGIDTEVATLAATAREPRTEQQAGITVHLLPVSANLPLKLANRAANLIWHYPYLAGALLHYRRLIRSRQYDIVHTETAFPLGLIAALTPKKQHPPLAVTLPGADIMAEPEYDYGYGRFAGVRAILPFVFRRADLLRADSPQIKTLAVRLGAHPDHVTTIPYNITADSFPPADIPLPEFRRESRAIICVRHGLDPKRPVIVSVNRLHPFKGFLHLIESVPHLHEHGLQPQLLVIGPNRSTPNFGDYGAFLRERAEALGVAGAVTFTGAVEHAETVRYYASADVGVVASVAESFSRVAIETAASGTPVVITRTTGASDYIAESGCGLVVEPRDGRSIALAIHRLISDPGLWEACSTRAPGFARRFDSATVAGDLYRLYQSFLGPQALTNALENAKVSD